MTHFRRLVVVITAAASCVLVPLIASPPAAQANSGQCWAAYFGNGWYTNALGAVTVSGLNPTIHTDRAIAAATGASLGAVPLAVCGAFAPVQCISKVPTSPPEPLVYRDANGNPVVNVSGAFADAVYLTLGSVSYALCLQP